MSCWFIIQFYVFVIASRENGNKKTRREGREVSLCGLTRQEAKNHFSILYCFSLTESVRYSKLLLASRDLTAQIFSSLTALWQQADSILENLSGKTLKLMKVLLFFSKTHLTSRFDLNNFASEFMQIIFCIFLSIPLGRNFIFLLLIICHRQFHAQHNFASITELLFVPWTSILSWSSWSRCWNVFKRKQKRSEPIITCSYRPK